FTYILFVFLLRLRRLSSSTLFPYTTLFRSFSWVDVRRYFVLPLFFNPLGVDIEALAITNERRVCGNCLVERNNRRHAFDLVLGKRTTRTSECFFTGFAPDNQLAQHGVELTADDRAHAHTGVDADARTSWFFVAGDSTWCWHEACGCVFTVDAELESVATWGGVFLDAQLLAFSDAELLAHQVQAGGFFSDWVLNLQTGVDLEEGDEAIGADQVFYGAGTVVACLAAD